MIDKPEPSENSEPQKPTFGVKFSKNVCIHPDTAKKKGIDLKDEDLKDTPWGRVLEIKRD